MERIRPRIFYVYALFRPDTGGVCYIGKGKHQRWLAQVYRLPHNIILARIRNKCGRDLIAAKIRVGLTESEAFEVEKALIKALGQIWNKTGCLANFAMGGEGPAGIIPTPKARKNMSNGQLGRKHSKESCAARSRRLKGRVFTPEWRKRLSVAAKERGHNGRRGPYPDFHRNAISDGVTSYWERWRTSPAVREERRRKIEMRKRERSV